MTSFEYNKNRKNSKDIYKSSNIKNSLNNIKRNSCQNKRNFCLSKSKIYLKKEIEKQKEENKIPLVSNTKFTIINILNNCLNTELYDGKNCLNNNQRRLSNDYDIKRIKLPKKRFTKMNRDSKLEGLHLANINKQRLNSVSSLSSESFNLFRKEGLIKQKKASEIKIILNKNKNKYNKRKSVELSNFNSKISNNLKNKYNNHNDKYNSFINYDSNYVSRKDLVKEFNLEDLNEKQISKIEENIVNDINLLDLKKKDFSIKKDFYR